jgi:hypothetical protein
MVNLAAKVVQVKMDDRVDEVEPVLVVDLAYLDQKVTTVHQAKMALLESLVNLVYVVNKVIPVTTELTVNLGKI